MTTERKRRLSKIERLSLSSDFGRVYAAGRSSRSRSMVFWKYARTDTELSRIGVVASKRALPKAHDRNRAKRLLREAFRNNKDLFSDAGDYVLIARRAIAGAGVADVVADLKKAIERN